jgi:hypothetical protein
VVSCVLIAYYIILYQCYYYIIFIYKYMSCLISCIIIDGREMKSISIADSSGRAVEGTNCLRLLQHCDRGFESQWRHGCLCVFCVFFLCLHSLR